MDAIAESIKVHQKLADDALARTKHCTTLDAKRRAFYVYRTNKRMVQQLQQLQQDRQELDEL